MTIVNEMIENPYQTRSDSFYFVDDVLVMHNKASYKVPNLTIAVNLGLFLIERGLVFAVFQRGYCAGEEEL